MNYRIKVFFRQLYNLYRWFPIIWKDRDWDDWYIFEILKFKIKNQAEHIGGNDFHTNAKRDAEIMMLCVRLIERIQKDYYGIEYLNYVDQEFKFIDSTTHPGKYELDIEIKSESFDDYFKKYPRISKQVVEEDQYKKAFRISRINEERVHKLLFKVLEHNIRRWWD